MADIAVFVMLFMDVRNIIIMKTAQEVVGHEAVESNKLDKIFDIFNPREKLNIYADVDGY